MVKVVIWLKDATEVFDETYQYLIENFSQTAAENFAKAVDHRIEIIVKQPTSGRRSVVPSVRFANIDSHRHIFL